MVCERGLDDAHVSEIFSNMKVNPEKEPGDLEVVFCFSEEEGVSALKELFFKYKNGQISYKQATDQASNLCDKYGPAVISSGNHCTKASSLFEDYLLELQKTELSPEDQEEVKSLLHIFEARECTVYALT